MLSSICVKLQNCQLPQLEQNVSHVNETHVFCKHMVFSVGTFGEQFIPTASYPVRYSLLKYTGSYEKLNIMDRSGETPSK